jgi:hypothetical protein
VTKLTLKKIRHNELKKVRTNSETLHSTQENFLGLHAFLANIFRISGNVNIFLVWPGPCGPLKGPGPPAIAGLAMPSYATV